MTQNDTSGAYTFLDRRVACTNSRFEVYFDRVSLPNGGELNDFITVRPRVQDENGIAGVIVLPEVNGKVGLMRTYRHQFGCEIWQAPGGFLEPGDSIRVAASRELCEETGLISDPNALVSLSAYCPDPGLIEAQVAIFLASCTESSEAPNRIPEIGAARLEFFSPKELRSILNSNESLIGGSTIVACYRYLDRLTTVSI
jgi:ADP-ribose pyrophosphatase YjhB (NUDIX family)